MVKACVGTGNASFVRPCVQLQYLTLPCITKTYRVQGAAFRTVKVAIRKFWGLLSFAHHLEGKGLEALNGVEKADLL